jgi:hypothetical protein
MRVSHEPCFGVKLNSKRPSGGVASQDLVSLEMSAASLLCKRIAPKVKSNPRSGRGMIVEDNFARARSRIGRIEKLQEFDELGRAKRAPRRAHGLCRSPGRSRPRGSACDGAYLGDRGRRWHGCRVSPASPVPARRSLGSRSFAERSSSQTMACLSRASFALADPQRPTRIPCRRFKAGQRNQPRFLRAVEPNCLRTQ